MLPCSHEKGGCIPRVGRNGSEGETGSIGDEQNQ
jgi:hypothetical protein